MQSITFANTANTLVFLIQSNRPFTYVPTFNKPLPHVPTFNKLLPPMSPQSTSPSTQVLSQPDLLLYMFIELLQHLVFGPPEAPNIHTHDGIDDGVDEGVNGVDEGDDGVDESLMRVLRKVLMRVLRKVLIRMC